MAEKGRIEVTLEKDGEPPIKLSIVGDFYKDILRCLQRGCGFTHALLKKVEKGEKV